MKKKFLYIILIVSIISIFYMLLLPFDGGSSSLHFKNNREIYFFDKNDTVIQNIKFNKDNVDSIAFIMYFEKDDTVDSKCNVTISLLDSKDNLIGEKKYNKNNIKGSEYNYIKFKKIKNSKNKDFKVIMKSNCSDRIAVEYYSDDDSRLLYNDQELKKGIIILEHGYSKTYIYIWYPIMIMLIDCLVLCFTNEKGSKKNDRKNKKK